MLSAQPYPVRHPPVVEEALNEIASLLRADYALAPRAVAMLLLAGDADMLSLVSQREGERAERIRRIVEDTQAKAGDPLNYVLMRRYYEAAAELAQGVVSTSPVRRQGWGTRLSEWTMRPWPGLPILGLVLYFGLYQVVGVFGAGTVVDWLESEVFEAFVNPWVNSLVQSYLPWPWLQELIGLDYGLVTLGLRYAVAIVLPVVGIFFLIFSLIEDSGYLPRLALLADRLFRVIGLNGRAVIPLVLGFGCDTMATVVSRTLETRRERVIATLLLALAIPCSAQLGVILAILAGRPIALLLWASIVFLVLLLVGYLAAKLLPGQKAGFYMEVPPLRWPRLNNVLAKTWARMQWYFLEVLPVFLFASVIIWAGRLTGLFDLAVRALAPLMSALGLPAEAAPAFLYGFFRRDYGAAGLYDLATGGALTGGQLLVAATTLTLFVPCIAQFSVMLKERGWRTTLGIVLFIFPFAFACGYLLNRLLVAVGVAF